MNPHQKGPNLNHKTKCNNLVQKTYHKYVENLQIFAVAVFAGMGIGWREAAKYLLKPDERYQLLHHHREKKYPKIAVCVLRKSEKISTYDSVPKIRLIHILFIRVPGESSGPLI